MHKQLFVVIVTAGVICAEPSIHWPSFRGPNASGVAEGHTTPTTWNVAKSENIKWKTPIPGLGHSSPVIWGDRIFVTTAIDEKKESSLKVGLYGAIEPVKDDSAQAWKVYCLDKKSGRIIWERGPVSGIAKTKRHPKSTHANPTPATDGKYLVAFFGSEGLYTYDMDGKLLWKKDLGVLDSGFFIAPEAQWGFSSSPVIHDDVVIVQCDVLTKPFLAAFRLKDGSQVWRTERDDVPVFSTPAVAGEGDKAQVIVNGFKHIGSYDALTGKEIWKLAGGGDIPTPTPVVAKDMVFITNAHGGKSPVYAIRLSAKGDISLRGDAQSNEHVAWSVPRDGAYMPTPVVYGDYLYICRDTGVLICYRAATGERMYQERLGSGNSGFSASLVAADGKVYASSEDGDIYVIQAGPQFRLLATNTMEEVTMATPAISEGTLFYRTRHNLVAIGKK